MPEMIPANQATYVAVPNQGQPVQPKPSAATEAPAAPPAPPSPFKTVPGPRMLIIPHEEASGGAPQQMSMHNRLRNAIRMAGDPFESETQAFHAAIAENPADDAHWLIAADHHDENGRPELASLFRAISQLPMSYNGKSRSDGTLKEPPFLDHWQTPRDHTGEPLRDWSNSAVDWHVDFLDREIPDLGFSLSRRVLHTREDNGYYEGPPTRHSSHWDLAITHSNPWNYIAQISIPDKFADQLIRRHMTPEKINSRHPQDLPINQKRLENMMTSARRQMAERDPVADQEKYKDTIDKIKVDMSRSGKAIHLSFDHADFLRAIHSNPEDQAPGLVYSDYLRELGEDRMADLYQNDIRPGWPLAKVSIGHPLTNSDVHDDYRGVSDGWDNIGKALVESGKTATGLVTMMATRSVGAPTFWRGQDNWNRIAWHRHPSIQVWNNQHLWWEPEGGRHSVPSSIRSVSGKSNIRGTTRGITFDLSHYGNGGQDNEPLSFPRLGMMHPEEYRLTKNPEHDTPTEQFHFGTWVNHDHAKSILEEADAFEDEKSRTQAAESMGDPLHHNKPILNTPERQQMAMNQAPAGDLVHRGINYKGGQFLPANPVRLPPPVSSQPATPKGSARDRLRSRLQQKAAV